MTVTKPTEIELELTYLAKEVPAEVRTTDSLPLLDIYIPPDPRVHSSLRLRKRGDTYEITKKIPLRAGDASVMQEFTIPISNVEFEALARASDKLVRKDRYKVVLNGHTAEVDVFRDKLEGLVLIDFEFATEAEKATFAPPTCCLADVTQEEFVAGGYLAGKGYSDIAGELTRFNYTSLE